MNHYVHYCAMCGDRLPDAWEYLACYSCQKAGRIVCPHGSMPMECDACDAMFHHVEETAPAVSR